MNCKKVQQKLSAYLDREVGEQEKSVIEAHLASCAACAGELSLLRTGDSHLEALAPAEPSGDFRARFWEKAREGEDAARRRSGVWEKLAARWIPVPVVMAGLIMLFSGFSVFSPVVYGGTEPGVKKEALQLAAATFAGNACRSVFGPANFAAFCERCSEMLCEKCRAGDACPDHSMCGRMDK